MEANLVEQEIGEELLGGKVVSTARAIVLVTKVSDDTHVAEAMATRGQKRVLNHLHANRTKEVLVELRRDSGSADGGRRLPMALRILRGGAGGRR